MSNKTSAKKSATKHSGHRYSSVEDLIKGEELSEDVKKEYTRLERETRLTRELARMRVSAGLTQEQLSERLGCSQSCISKWEAGRDDDLTLKIIHDYCRATNSGLGLYIGKRLNHVEAVKLHAFKIKEHLQALAKLARDNEDLEQHIRAFFGEAFFNILEILSRCHEQLGQPREAETIMQFNRLDSPRPLEHATSC